MPNKNYIAGVSFESRFIKKLVKDGKAVKAGRFYASKGTTDVWWVDQNGVHHEAQLKYSSKKEPYISPAEIQQITLFAQKFKRTIPTWIVRKQAHKPIIMERVFV